METLISVPVPSVPRISELAVYCLVVLVAGLVLAALILLETRS